MTNAHPAVVIYQKTFPKESKESLGDSNAEIAGSSRTALMPCLDM